MPELTTADLEQYTQGRLTDDNEDLERLLSAALAAARRYCGWHVTPVLEDHVVTLDGPASALLVLPTLKLVELTALTENGIEVDLDYVAVSSRGVIRKKYGYPLSWPTGYCWTAEYSGIVATMTHGFDEAPDWQSAVLSLVDRWSIGGGFSTGGAETVGPFTFSGSNIDAGSMFSSAEKMILDLYRLESAP